MHCPACGATVMEEAKFCHQCGQALSGLAASGEQPPAEPPRAPAAPQTETVLPGDDELWSGSFSPRAMIGAWVGAAAFTIAALIVLMFFGQDMLWWLIGLGVVVAVWLWQFVSLILKRLDVRYRLTAQRFIYEKGIFRRVMDRIELFDIDDITVEQGLVERLIGIGTIRVSSTDRTQPELRMKGIENVKEVASLFDDARLKERRRRGVQIVSNPPAPI